MLLSLSQKTKGILSVMSGIIMNMVCGSLYSWSGINGYYISYLRNTGSPTIEIKDGYFFMPIITFTSMCVSPIVAIINGKKGVKIISLISTFLIFITNIVLYNSTNVIYVYGCMIFYGIINSMNYMPVIKNCLFYFPEKKGLINGFILFGYGTSSLIYNSIADYLINPSYHQINPSTGFFDFDIAINVKKYLKFFTIFNGIISILSYLLLFEYKKSENDDKENNLREKNLEKKIEINENSKIKEKEEEGITVKEAFIQAAKGIQLYQLWTMSTVLQIVSFTVTNTFRSFAQQCLMEEHFLSNLTKTYSILNGFSRLIWGYLFDKFSFKCLYSICMITQAIVDSFLYNSVHYPILFFFLICFQSLVVSGKISLNVTMFTKVYGIKYFGLIYSVSTAIGGFCHLLEPFIIKIVVKKLEDYKILYIGGSFGAIFCFMILLNFSEKKFKFKSDENEKELKEMLNKP